MKAMTLGALFVLLDLDMEHCGLRQGIIAS
jgi:hypothetical protein